MDKVKNSAICFVVLPCLTRFATSISSGAKFKYSGTNLRENGEIMSFGFDSRILTQAFCLSSNPLHCVAGRGPTAKQRNDHKSQQLMDNFSDLTRLLYIFIINKRCNISIRAGLTPQKTIFLHTMVKGFIGNLESGELYLWADETVTDAALN